MFFFLMFLFLSFILVYCRYGVVGFVLVFSARCLGQGVNRTGLSAASALVGVYGIRFRGRAGRQGWPRVSKKNIICSSLGVFAAVRLRVRSDCVCLVVE